MKDLDKSEQLKNQIIEDSPTNADNPSIEKEAGIGLENAPDLESGKEVEKKSQKATEPEGEMKAKAESEKGSEQKSAIEYKIASKDSPDLNMKENKVSLKEKLFAKLEKYQASHGEKEMQGIAMEAKTEKTNATGTRAPEEVNAAEQIGEKKAVVPEQNEPEQSGQKANPGTADKASQDAADTAIQNGTDELDSKTAEKPRKSLFNTDPKFIIIAMVLAAILLVVVASIYFGRDSVGGTVTRGLVAAPSVSLISDVQGIMRELSVSVGDSVKKGDALAVIDSSVQENAVAALALELTQKQEDLEHLNQGPDPQVLQQSQETVTTAESAYNNASKEFAAKESDYNLAAATYDNAVANRDSLKELYDQGAISFDEYQSSEQTIIDTGSLKKDAEEKINTAKKEMDTAKTRLDNAKKQYAQVSAGPDLKEVVAAETSITETQQKIELAKAELEKYTLKATCDGVISAINYEKGDIVAIGYDVFDISDQEEAYIVTYLTKGEKDKITKGQPVKIRIENEEYNGEVLELGQFSVKPPKELQLSANANEELYEIKIKTNPEDGLMPGQLVDLLFEKKSGS